MAFEDFAIAIHLAQLALRLLFVPAINMQIIDNRPAITGTDTKREFCDR